MAIPGKERQAALRARLKAQGVCARSGCAAPVDGKELCEVHRASHNNYQRVMQQVRRSWAKAETALATKKVAAGAAATGLHLMFLNLDLLEATDRLEFFYDELVQLVRDQRPGLAPALPPKPVRPEKPDDAYWLFPAFYTKVIYRLKGEAHKAKWGKFCDLAVVIETFLQVDNRALQEAYAEMEEAFDALKALVEKRAPTFLTWISPLISASPKS